MHALAGAMAAPADSTWDSDTKTWVMYDLQREADSVLLLSNVEYLEMRHREPPPATGRVSRSSRCFSDYRNRGMPLL
jgi:hypothetical protein